MSPLDKSDYEEPACLLCMGTGDPDEPLMKVPLDRVMDKLDEYLNAEDWAAAERHLLYWLAEAKAGRDRRAMLSLENERMGFYRKQGREKEAFASAAAALSLVEELNMRDSLTAGTTYVNAATVNQAFGRPEGALPLFAKARKIYESSLKDGDGRLGGLYNNMGLALTALERYSEAEEAYDRALAVMERVPGSEPERAITKLNLADAYAAQENEEAVNACLEQAEALLKTPGLVHDAYFSYVCSRCAPVFDHYGWFAAARETEALRSTP